ncbi:MAG TPA: hypothetical protein GXX40_05980 [Firmicutes bacterium]|nr:hypothetical protein [Bacillota bacterium]
MGREWGLALGGGGVYGFAHLGVLEVLEKAGLKPTHVSGTSAGSIVAGLYCSGISLTRIGQFGAEALAFEVARKGELKSLDLLSGLLPGTMLEKAMDVLLKGRLVRDVSPELYIEAVDVNSGRLVIFAPQEPAARASQGKTVYETGAKISAAIRASISIPGLFQPKRLGDMQLVDGGVLDMVPVQSLVNAGVRPIVAVDLGGYAEKPAEPRNAFSLIWRCFSIQARELTSVTLASRADVVITPVVEDMDIFDFDKIKECVRRGGEAAREKLPEIAFALTSPRVPHGNS